MSVGTFVVRWRTRDGAKRRSRECDEYEEAAEIAEELAGRWHSDGIMRVSLYDLTDEFGGGGGPLVNYSGDEPPDPGYWYEQNPFDDEEEYEEEEEEETDEEEESDEVEEDEAETEEIEAEETEEEEEDEDEDEADEEDEDADETEDEEEEAYAMPSHQTQITRVAPAVPTGPSALAATFAADAHELVRMGVRLDKGATLAEGAGLGAAGVAAFGGHWLLAAGAAIVGALASAGAHYYKQKKIDEMREKWRYVLSGLDDDGLRQFVLEVRRFYPQVAAALSANTLGNYGTQRLLTWGK